ncbi:YozE family protein [Mammaliicoccus sciuri]|uniref:YozE family protein n=1 Tax=Mammaliicoccus sciuri TaxID=1296 RepID=UPI002DB56B83|nr:YozE family protein [Mammaliicoccus sciuri]MEB7784227.1 sterile alpha motif-like domain-containing protein [Mammaliicoccus sciuri]
MSFYDFIQKYSDDDTPLGELADLIIHDANFPKDEESEENLLLYFRTNNIEDTYFEYIKRALSLYSQYKFS